jgi:hypothetical protein
MFSALSRSRADWAAMPEAAAPMDFINSLMGFSR